MDKYKLINFCGCQSPQHAPVAQGIERQPPELKAAGSNPAGRTRYKMAISILIAILL
jgi:hypothetical protein